MAANVGVFVNIGKFVRHVEEEAVAIDAVAKLWRVVRVPSEDDGLIVLWVDGGPQIVGCIASILAATSVVQRAQQASFQSRRRSAIFVNHLILGVFHFERNIGNGGTGFSPIQVVVAKCHLEFLKCGRRRI